jgi:ABC-type nitrate/sulfonate/bicarbonate transport system substrate-binding protein
MARRAALAWSVAIALAAPACARRGGEPLTMGIVRMPAMGLVYVAQAKGYFDAHGVAVELRPFASGPDALAAVGAGKLDVAAVLETPVVLRAPRDPTLVVLTTLHVAAGNTRLVARRDRGISSETDLAGKRVGFPRGSNAEYLVAVLLAAGGVALPDVTLVDVAPDALPRALAAGELDAAALWEPHAHEARRLLGPGGYTEVESDLYVEISMLATRDEVSRARRGALVRVVRALADADRLVRERPDEAFQAIRAAFPELEEGAVRAAWARVRPELGLTNQLAALLEDESQWFRGSGRASGPPVDVGRVLDPGVLSEVDLEAVTFVRPPRPLGER